MTGENHTHQDVGCDRVAGTGAGESLHGGIHHLPVYLTKLTAGVQKLAERQEYNNNIEIAW